MGKDNKVDKSLFVDLSLEYLEVYCAWCNNFLYKTEATYNLKYSASHGICKECSEKVFGLDDKKE